MAALVTMASCKVQLNVLALISLLVLGKAVNQDALSTIEQNVREILNHVRERDRLDQQKEQERVLGTVELLNMDSTLKRIEQQIADLSKQFRTATGRSGVATGEVQNLEIRIDSLEDNVVSNVKGSIKKMEDVQKQADSIRVEMERKLGKMMNLMTAVHKEIGEKTTSKDDENENDGSSTLFISEELDALERKLSESLSISRETLMSEIRKIKLELFEPFSECKELAQQVDDMKSKCDGSSSPHMSQEVPEESMHWQRRSNEDYLIQNITDVIMKNLSRVQREISDIMNKKLQDIEQRISANQQQQQSHLQPYNRRGESDYGSRSFATTPLAVAPPSPTTSTTERQQEKPRDCRALRYEVPKPHSCSDLRKAGASCSGQYIIFPKGMKAVYAYCDMIKDGGGWTVLMRRGDFSGPQVNFDQKWQAYKVGFGDISGEFWIGNENIHMLTSGQETMTLQVILEAFDGSHITINFDQFWIESEENNYKLHLGSGNRSQAYHASSLLHHNGHGFTTHDRNNDAGSQNCAVRYRGGWWYNRCHYALLTAPRFARNQFRHKWQGMQWHAWKGNEALKAAEMRIRPRAS